VVANNEKFLTYEGGGDQAGDVERHMNGQRPEVRVAHENCRPRGMTLAPLFNKP
jgi:hypothetical protein